MSRTSGCRAAKPDKVSFQSSMPEVIRRILQMHPQIRVRQQDKVPARPCKQRIHGKASTRDFITLYVIAGVHAYFPRHAPQGLEPVIPRMTHGKLLRANAADFQVRSPVDGKRPRNPERRKTFERAESSKGCRGQRILIHNRRAAQDWSQRNRRLPHIGSSWTEAQAFNEQQQKRKSKQPG